MSSNQTSNLYVYNIRISDISDGSLLNRLSYPSLVGCYQKLQSYFQTIKLVSDSDTVLSNGADKTQLLVLIYCQQCSHIHPICIFAVDVNPLPKKFYQFVYIALSSCVMQFTVIKREIKSEENNSVMIDVGYSTSIVYSSDTSGGMNCLLKSPRCYFQQKHK